MFEPWEKIDIQEIRRTSRAEGEVSGETKGISKVVRRMLAKNKPVDEIADDTGFSVDEILSLKGSF
jgi:predicted transposase YdaD